jgi:hypothetical protein
LSLLFPYPSYAALYLKESTAVTLKVGPFLDSTDGVTAETGLTISQSDVLLSKNGSAFTQKNDATACTHDTGGWYGCPINITDTNTRGNLQLSIQESGALPVFHDYLIFPANPYDSLITATDTLWSDIQEVSGTAITDNSDGRLEVNVEEISDVSVSTTTAQLGVNVVNVGGTAQTANDNGADINSILTYSVSSAAWGSINSGLIFRGTVTSAVVGVSFTISGLAAQGDGAFISTDGAWYAYVFRDASGVSIPPQGETREITGYTSATGLFTTESFTVPVEIGDDIFIYRRIDVNIKEVADNPVQHTGGLLHADVKEVSGSTVGMQNFQDMYDGTGYAGGTTPLNVNITHVCSDAIQDNNDGRLEVNVEEIEDADPTDTIADGVWDETLTGANHNTATTAGRRLRELGSFAIRTGTAQAGSSDTITLDASASATNDIYEGGLVVLIDNTGAGQTRKIISYDGSTKVAVVSEEWVTNPDATTEYQILASVCSEHILHGTAQAGSVDTITLPSDASSTNDIYNDSSVHISSGAGASQTRLIIDYDGGTKVATISPAWQTSPDSTSRVHVHFSERVNIERIQDDSVQHVGGILWASVREVSGSRTASENFLDMYDGTGYAGGTELLHVDVREVSGSIDAGDNFGDMYDGTGYAGGTTVFQSNITQVGGDAITDNNDGRLEVNLEEISDVAVSATTAQLGVNVVNYGNSAVTATVAGIPDVNVTYWEDSAVSDSDGVPDVNTIEWDDSAITDSDSEPDVDFSATSALNASITEINGNPVQHTGGLLWADVKEVSGSETGMQNFQDMYDGTGYAGGTAKLGINIVQVGGDAITDNNDGVLEVNIAEVEDQVLSANVGDNFETFFENGGALTAKTVNDVGVAGSGLTAAQVWANTDRTLTSATNLLESGRSSIRDTDGIVWADIKEVSGSTTSAGNLDDAFDGSTGYAFTGSTMPTTTTVTNRVTANTDQIEGSDATDQLTSIFSTSMGTGSAEGVLTVTVSGTPIDNVKTWLTTDEAGSNIYGGPAYTNATGQVDFMVDVSTTYYVWREHSGYDFTNPQSWRPTN